MRACIFVDDLGTIPERKAALVAEARALAGQDVKDVCFVGFRQTRAIDADTLAYQPHVSERYTPIRLANTALRLVDARMAPLVAARAALRVCAPGWIEAILASDPDLVLIYGRWGRYLATLVEEDFPGAVFVTGDAAAGRRLRRPAANETEPLVSIVLPTYNGSKYIRQSITSCLEQSYRNLELIVVDDGSRENIAGIVAEFDDSRLRYIRHEKNRGLPETLNTGFRHTAGDLLTWTSDDNYYASDAIERMAGFLRRHPGISFVYTSMHIIDDTASGRHPLMWPALPPARLREQNCVGGCFLYTREVYREVGDYNAATVLVEDYDYWVRVSKRFRMQRLVAPLYHYRHHAGSLTAQHGTEQIAVRFDMVRQQNEVA
jgi:hypothetical protein